uniref:Glutamine-tRNA ligase, putative / glutaminyl-tRNA synthetase, putative / GlnRS n=1 Tax=Tanacetum cinerariifolium TaxID=118510 RepID=A0A6L2NKD0_TANCI|nr:glutamine-tRNA ligase, putative / glutaminyl-tRNA synthetase, putative / GlnRS [Tanacetum cinerariifolium]
MKVEDLRNIAAIKIRGADMRKKGNHHVVILFTHKGVIHYVDLLSEEITWAYETGKVVYQSNQGIDVGEYVDMGSEHDYPYFYQAIPGKIVKEIQKSIKFLFKKNLKIKTNQDEFHLNPLTGENMVDGPDVLRFTRTDWDISMENPHWCLRYSNLDVSFQSSKCIVLYAHTAESFMKMCETFGFIKVCGESILARTINMSRRIHLVNREDKFVKNKGILCLDGYSGIYKKDVVFVKKVPMVKEFLPIKEVYKRFSDNPYVIRHITVKSDANYEYIVYEKMDGTLADLVGAHMMSV